MVVQTPDDFGGVERAVFDQVLTENECQDLIHLASMICHAAASLLVVMVIVWVFMFVW